MKNTKTIVKYTISSFFIILISILLLNTTSYFGVGYEFNINFEVTVVLIMACFATWYILFTQFKHKGDNININGQHVSRRRTTTYIVIIALIGLMFTGTFSIIVTSSRVDVGVDYNYFDYDLETVQEDMERLSELGFCGIRIYYYVVNFTISNDDAYLRTLNLLQSAEENNIEVTLETPVYVSDHFEDYVSHFAEYIDIYQLANELDTVHQKVGYSYIFNYEELETIVTSLKNTIAKYDSDFETIVTWSQAFETRVDLIGLGGTKTGLGQICSHVDHVGYDVYLSEGLAVLPYAINLLKSTSQKPVWITETGMTTTNDEEQANYILEILEYASKNNISRVYIFDYNRNWLGYSIKGRLAETEISNWLERNHR